MLYTYSKIDLDQSGERAFSLSLPDLNMTGKSRKQAYRRVACMAPRVMFGVRRRTTAYYMRCKQLEILGNSYFKDIKFKLLDYERAVKVKEQYDAAIFIKSTPDLKWWPKIWKSFKKIYVDVIDGANRREHKRKGGGTEYLIDWKHLKTKSPRAALIVQNVHQAILYNASFDTIIIEHMPASLNDSEWVSTSSLSHPLRAISSTSRQWGICENINTSSVILRCVESYDAEKLFESELNVRYKDYSSRI